MNRLYLLLAVWVLWPCALLAQGIPAVAPEYLDESAAEASESADFESEFERYQLATEDSSLTARTTRPGRLHGIASLRTGSENLQRVAVTYDTHLRLGYSRAGSAEIRKLGPIDRLVIGNYHLRSGFGLTLWTGGMRPFAGRDPIANVSHTGSGAAAYNGTRPSAALKGAAISLAPGYHSQVTLFASRQSHTSIAGTTVEYRTNRILLGLSTLAHSDSILYGVRSGLYSQVSFGPITGFGETTLPDQRIFSGLLLRTLDLGEVIVSFRSYPPSTYSAQSVPVLSRVTPRRGEQGIYAGLRLRPHPNWTILASSDQYRLGQDRSYEPFDPTGYAHLIALEHHPRPWLAGIVQFRVTRESSYLPGQHTMTATTLLRRRLRLDLRYDFSPVLSTISRAEAVWYRKGSYRSNGILILHEASLQLGTRLSMIGRYGTFDTDDFETRFATLERDVAYAFSAPALYGNGTRAYLLLRFAPLSGMTVEGRYARTLCREEEATSLVPGQSVRDTFRIQARFAW